MTSAIVVGGGIAGLTAANTLLENGVADVTVFESNAEFGGVIASGELRLIDGSKIAIDVGAESFALTSPATKTLIADIGLTDSLAMPASAAAKQTLDSAFDSSSAVSPADTEASSAAQTGAAKSMTARIRTSTGSFEIPAGVLGIPANLDDAAVANYLSQDELAEAKALDAAPWQFDPSSSQAITLGEVVRVRLGEAVLERLVTPVVAGVHASHPDLIEAAAVSPSLLAAGAETGSLIGAVGAIRGKTAIPGAAVAGLVGGMHSLISRLSQHLSERGVKLEVGSRVLKIKHDGQTWAATLATKTARADLLVVAVNSNLAAQLLVETPQLAEPLSRIKTLDVAVVALSVTSQKLNENPLGSGVLVAPEVNQTTSIGAKASTHINAKWPWVESRLPDSNHLLRLSYGRGSDLPPVSTPEDQLNLVAQAAADARALYDAGDIELIDSQVIIWRDALVQAKPGHGAILAEIEAAEQRLGNVAVVGVGLGGNGMTGIIAKTKLKVTNMVTRYGNNEMKEAQ